MQGVIRSKIYSFLILVEPSLFCIGCLKDIFILNI